MPVRQFALAALVIAALGSANVCNAAGFAGGGVATDHAATAGITRVWYDRSGRWHPDRPWSGKTCVRRCKMQRCAGRCRR